MGKKDQDLCVALIRSKGTCTIEDMIIDGHISSKEAHETLTELLRTGTIKIESKDGRVRYISA